MLVLFSSYIFSTPYFSDRKPFNYLVYGIFALFTIIVVAYRFLFYDYKKTNLRIATMPLFAVFSSIGTILLSHQFRYLLTVVLLAFSFVIIFFMLEQVGNNDLIIRLAIYSLTLFVFLFVLHYRKDILSFSNFGSNRLAVDNYFDNVNTVAYYFAGCCILSLYYAFFSKKTINLLFLIPFVVSFYVGILTASRTFLVGVTLSSLTIFIIRFKKKPIVLIIGLVVIIAGVVLLFTLPTFSMLKKRLIDMFNMMTGLNYSTDYSTATRILWQDYATYFGSRHLIFGVGLNGFYVYSGTDTYSHANITELLCNTGVVGLLLYYSIFFVAFYDLIDKKNKYNPIIITLLVFLISREFLGVTYTSKFNAFVFAFISYSGSLGIYKKSKNNNVLKNDYCLIKI
ncbi:MAG TPA: hypothetical protein DDW20_05145 [Firmicutes bacterium]|nr:hypothetical protein [Bacillota bacterium]